MNSQIAVFGGGCFWCTEAVFLKLKGVNKVTSGYAGGTTDHPTDEQVYSGKTGHAEVIQIEFDPDVIPYQALLEVFFHSHDPTSLNRQGNDTGTQYRSVIFYTNPEQKEQATAFIQELERNQEFSRPIVTTLEPLTQFYPAEAYHQNFYASNPDQPYCRIMISPKVQKVQEKYAHLLKA